jgi:hypothetical protein
MGRARDLMLGCRLMVTRAGSSRIVSMVVVLLDFLG